MVGADLACGSVAGKDVRCLVVVLGARGLEIVPVDAVKCHGSGLYSLVGEDVEPFGAC